MRPIRSLLFAPANRHDLIRKFPRYAADAFAIDLEDGTPEAEKDSARREMPQIVGFLRDAGLRAQIFVRTNSPRSSHVLADLAAAAGTQIDGLLVPKVETAADLDIFTATLRDAEKRSGHTMHTIGLIETTRGVVNVETLAANTSGRLAALAFGAEDFITDIGGRRTPAGLEVLYARSRVVLAASAAGIPALDQVFVSLRDDEGFRRDAELGRELGYGGKMCVIPRQIEIANSIFSPSADEIDRSRRLVEAYESAKAQGRGVVEFEGSMIDEPMLKRARAIVEQL
jgi:citrate lyase subunit beta/citryl-CoA lyase